jgi:hypothetical protein
MTPVGSPPFQHQPHALNRLERADQHRGGVSLGLGHGVHEIVDAVVQVDVGKTRRAIERRIAARRPGSRVTRGIVLADIGFRFDDHPGGDAGRRAMHEDLAEELLGDDQGRTVVERA